MANYTHYKIIVPKKILDELDLETTGSLVTKSGTTPIWFSGYSFNAAVVEGVLHFSTNSYNRDFLKVLSSVCPDDIIHVVGMDEYDGRERVSLWKDGRQVLQFVEDLGGFNNAVAEYITCDTVYKKLLDGTWKEIFGTDFNPREVDEDTLEVTVTLGGDGGFCMDDTGMVTVTQNPLRVRIYQTK